MTAANGIHAHASKKLGAKPEDKSKPKLAFAHHLAAVPDHPIIDAPPTGVEYPMDNNDRAGDCVVAGSHHGLQVVFDLLGTAWDGWTLDQILTLYQTQNPGFQSWSDAGGNSDQGMIIAQFLAWLVKNGEQFGLTGERKLLGFAKVDHRNHDQMRAALYLGLVLITGASLQVAQQSGKEWKFVPGSPEWGGHCTAQHGYNDGSMNTISWGADDYVADNSFIENSMDEAYIVITQAHVNHPGFRDHFDLYSFSQAFTAMTGRPFPIQVDPPGPTPPTPAPTPGGGATFQVDDSTAARISHAATRKGVSSEAWVQDHFHHYFHL